MKVIIHSKKKLTENKNKKRVVKEELFTAAALTAIGWGALGGFLTTILGALFPKIKQLFSGIGQRLAGLADRASGAVNNSSLPPDAKKKFMEKFEAAKADLQKTLNELKEKTGKTTAGEERPSAIIAKKVQAMVQVISETTTEYAELFKKDPKSLQELNSSIEGLGGLLDGIKSLDFTAAISSKQDKNGLWAAIPDKVKPSFSDDESWLKFTQAFAIAVDEKSRENFKSEEIKLPSTVSRG